MYDTVCNLSFAAQINTLAVHPTEPTIAVGLVSGHVEARRLSSAQANQEAELEPRVRRGSDGIGIVEALWKTRRHKGSCRSICFDHDGTKIMSTGTDGIVKGADAQTGRVEWKLRAPQKQAKTALKDQCDLLWCPSPQTLALSTENDALHLYDLRQLSTSRPAQSFVPHAKDISSLTPLPSSVAQQCLMTTGSSSIAITDLRKGLLQDREMGEESFASCSLPADGIVVGGERGLLRFWTDARNLPIELGSSSETRVHLIKNETIDTLCTPPKHGTLLAAGLGDGSIKLVDFRSRKIVASLQHDDIEPVVGLGFESEGRLVSAGGQNIKIWQESTTGRPVDGHGQEVEEVECVSLEEIKDEGEDDSEDQKPKNARKKRRKGKGKNSPNGILGIKGLV